MIVQSYEIIANLTVKILINSVCKVRTEQKSLSVVVRMAADDAVPGINNDLPRAP